MSLQQLARDLKYQLRDITTEKELRINACLRPDVLTSKIMHALATGNWVGGRSGVSQLLDRTTYLAALSHMRRVTNPLVRANLTSRPEIYTQLSGAGSVQTKPRKDRTAAS